MNSTYQAAAGPRVRKELRALTNRQYKLLLQGLNTMLSVPTAEGQKKFGSK